MFTLIRFASSKRMRSTFFQSNITVIAAKKERPTLLRWPSNESEWKELLWAIDHKCGLLRVKTQKVANKEQQAATKASEYGVAGIMHCECAIIAHLHQHTASPAFSYVGVSKLSCKPCYHWIKAYNYVMNTNFRTRDTHDKWYWGWARPGLAKPDIQFNVDARFLSLVEGELCKHQMGSDMARKRASSS